ncbi:hypothetical protein AL473_09680 [Klebsiella quasipneumoniae]|nr:hypothetical protein AL473_09680 [Klebsiella quasipneumoniae]AWO60499.1 hypothetical protein DLJ73_05300 [Klebsiella quasipneumoniae subsp. similipneumoniae]
MLIWVTFTHITSLVQVIRPFGMMYLLSSQTVLWERQRSQPRLQEFQIVRVITLTKDQQAIFILSCRIEMLLR